MIGVDKYFYYDYGYERYAIVFYLTRKLSTIYNIFKTDYNDKKRLKEVVAETASRVNMRITSSGNIAAAKRALSYISQCGMFNDYPMWFSICKISVINFSNTSIYKLWSNF